MLKGETDKGSWENLIGFAGLIIAAVAIFCIILLIKELHGG